MTQGCLSATELQTKAKSLCLKLIFNEFSNQSWAAKHVWHFHRHLEREMTCCRKFSANLYHSKTAFHWLVRTNLVFLHFAVTTNFIEVLNRVTRLNLEQDLELCEIRCSHSMRLDLSCSEAMPCFSFLITYLFQFYA